MRRCHICHFPRRGHERGNIFFRTSIQERNSEPYSERWTLAVKHALGRTTLLLFLYGTGALLSEAINLKIEDVDLKERKITINNRVLTRCRQIPICDDLCDVLRRYLSWRVKGNLRCPRFFVTKKVGRSRQDPSKRNFVEFAKAPIYRVNPMLRINPVYLTSKVPLQYIG